jgi:hypothetical protein
LGFQNPQSRQASSQGIALAQAAGNTSSPSTESSGERALKNPIRRRRLLRADGERPRDCRAAEQRDERAAPHSITSSARASNMGGTVRPSALAVFRSMTRSNFVEARRMRVCYPSRPSARMVSCTNSFIYT